MRSVASLLAVLIPAALGTAALGACSKKAESRSTDPAVAPSAPAQGTGETIAVPGAAPANPGAANPGAANPGAAPAPGADPAGAPAGAAPSGAPDTSFALKVTPPVAGAAGAEVVARVEIVPGSGYKMNKEYPTKLVVQPPAGVAIAKAEQVLEDGTFDPHKLSFDVKVTPAKAGTYPVSGTIRFAVCTDATCDPKKQTIAFDVVAK